MDDVIDDRAGLFVVGSVYEQQKKTTGLLLSFFPSYPWRWPVCSYVNTVLENEFE